MNFKDEIIKYKEIIDKRLDKLVELRDIPQRLILESMRYSLLAGGKRLRPILCIKACELFGGNVNQVLDFACAIEMIHTYSLIHDDLPSMDDDNYRRGKLTNHRVYGEAIAILAGDALLNLAYETFIDTIIKNNNSSKFAKAFKEISTSSGINGMIGGQVLDIINENKLIDLQTLDLIHNYKTSSLLEASLVAGALIGGASDFEVNSLRTYGKKIGLSFQIRDDILDVIGEQEKIGKDIGSDEENNKCTYVTLFGLEKSIELCEKLSEEAINQIKKFDNLNKDFFIELSKYIIDRES